jgi:hypothetical protein
MTARCVDTLDAGDGDGNDIIMEKVGVVSLRPRVNQERMIPFSGVATRSKMPIAREVVKRSNYFFFRRS